MYGTIWSAIAGLFTRKTAVLEPDQIPQKPDVSLEFDIDTVARTIWGEARGEPVLGMEAVACVIATRARLAHEFIVRTGKHTHPLFGDGTLASVCLRPYQFSCWNADDANLPKMKSVNEQDEKFVQCLTLARRLAAGLVADRTGQATHYYDPRVVTPDWAKKATFTTSIGNHRFYKDVP